MAYTVVYNEHLHIVELTSQTDVRSTDIQEAVVEIFQLVKDHTCNRVLIDWSGSQVFLTVTGIYELPQIISRVADSFQVPIHRVKRALLVAAKTEDFLFYENVTHNRGQSVRFFTDRAEALEWLLSEH